MSGQLGEDSSSPRGNPGPRLPEAPLSRARRQGSTSTTFRPRNVRKPHDFDVKKVSNSISIEKKGGSLTQEEEETPRARHGAWHSRHRLPRRSSPTP